MHSPSTESTALEFAGGAGADLPTRCGIPVAAARAVSRLCERQNVRSGILLCQHPPFSRDGRDLYALTRAVQTGHWWSIASTAFPSDRLPASWVAPLRAMDEVWVPSAFHAATFARSGVDDARIHVVPARFPQFTRPARPGESYAIATEKRFRFLAVLPLDERRGWKTLIRAWLESFTPNDDVALVVQVLKNRDDATSAVEAIAEAIVAMGRDPSDIPEIVVVEEPLSSEACADVLAQAHAFVLPTRGENWNQPMFEAFAMGVPVVTTRFGGPLAYLNDHNAFLVDVAGLVPVAEDVVEEHPELRGHRWAEPDFEALRIAMRAVFDDPGEARRRAAEAASAARTSWTKAAALKRVTARIGAIERAAAAWPALAIPRDEADVLWRAPVYDQSGYASEAREFLKGLADRGVFCKASPLVWSPRVATLDDADRMLFHGLCERPLAERAISVQHHFPPHFQRDRAQPVAIGRTMFETDRIPESWVAPCNAMDEIWVPSAQNVESFSASGVDRAKIVVVPGTFDFAAYTKEGPRHPEVAARPFTFLSVFDWHLRKGWDVLLRAYVEGFAGRSDVSLVMKLQPSSGQNMETIRKGVRDLMRHAAPRGKSPPPVQFVGSLREGELPALYRSADVFVLPTRGEGFGRPFAEAMAAGVPAIGTRYSGHVDFMDDSNSWLIDYDLVPVPEPALREVPTFRGHRWAEPRVDHLRRLMIEARESPDVVAAKGAQSAVDVRAKLSRDRVIGIIRARLDHWRKTL